MTLVLLFRCTFAQRPGQLVGNQVCLLVPPEVETCYRRFHGKPIDARAAQVNCLQVKDIIELEIDVNIALN